MNQNNENKIAIYDYNLEHENWMKNSKIIQKLNNISSFQVDGWYTNISQRIRDPPGKIGFPFPVGKMLFYLGWDKKAQVVKGAVEFLTAAQGPPDRTHGGAAFTILDEASGLCSKMAASVYNNNDTSNQKRLTAGATMNYRGPIKLNQPYQVQVEVKSVTERGKNKGIKLVLYGKIFNDDDINDIVADLDTTFIVRKVAEEDNNNNNNNNNAEIYKHKVMYDNQGVILSPDRNNEKVTFQSIQDLNIKWQNNNNNNNNAIRNLIHNNDNNKVWKYIPRNKQLSIYTKPSFTTGKMYIDSYANVQKRYILAPVQFLNTCEGHAKACHGGSVATAFDTITAGFLIGSLSGLLDDLETPVDPDAYGDSNNICFTMSLSVSYKSITPLLETLLIKVWVENGELSKTSGRAKLNLKGQLTNMDQSILYAESESLWLSNRALSEVELDKMVYIGDGNNKL